MDSENWSAGPGLLSVLAGDGRRALAVAAVGLIVSGLFAFFLSATNVFLPHDLAWLGMTASQLVELADGRIADFMVHDRVAFGGTLVAVGILYLWLIAVPLRRQERWAWWAIATSAAAGFASFGAWLGYGYLDAWHATATLALAPLFVVGLVRTRPGITGSGNAGRRRPLGRFGAGRALVLLTGVGMLVAGVTILSVGTLIVFVPQDLAFLGLDRHQLDALHPRLVPLIAHDRAGFGGGLVTAGLLIVACALCAEPSRSLRQALAAAGAIGFGAAIGVHALVGYLDPAHVGPAVVGAAVLALGIGLLPTTSSTGRERERHAGLRDKAEVPGRLRSLR